MMTASARLLLGNRLVGTAWRFHSRFALTAAHCLGDQDRPQQLPEAVQLKFTGLGPIPARRTKLSSDLDVALLEIGELPGQISAIDLARPPPETAPEVPWQARAYPHVNQGEETLLTGQVRGYVEAKGGRALQLGLDDFTNQTVGGVAQLKFASGAAVTFNGCAIGLLRSGLAGTHAGHATPMDRIGEAFPEVRDRLLGYPVADPNPRWRECDRRKQWEGVVAAIAERGTRIVTLSGPAAEEHAVFIDRIAAWLARDKPHARMRRVAWQEAFTTADLLAALSIAFGGPADADEVRLGARLLAASGERSVVVHPVLRDASANDLEIVGEYYGRLAKMLAPGTAASAPSSAWGWLFVQPIAWTSWLKARRARWLVRRLARKPSPEATPLPIRPLPALRRISDDDDLVECGADAAVVARWRKDPTTREAFRLLRTHLPRRP